MSTFLDSYPVGDLDESQSQYTFSIRICIYKEMSQESLDLPSRVLFWFCVSRVTKSTQVYRIASTLLEPYPVGDLYESQVQYTFSIRRCIYKEMPQESLDLPSRVLFHLR